MLTPSQLIAARGLLRWSSDDLADASGTSRHTVYAFESRGSSPTLRTVQAWIAALHSAGVILLDEDEQHGPGVRLRKGTVVAVPKAVEAKARAKAPGAKGKARKP